MPSAPPTAIREDRYPSRVAPRPRLIPRVDPVLYPGGPVTDRLSRDRIAFYESNGYVSEPILDEEEVAALTGEVSRLVAGGTLRDAEETITEPSSDAVRSIFRIHALSPLFARLARDRRLLDVARQILGSEVYLHQSRVNLKPGFVGKEFYWHSDFETWHVEDGMPSMRALSVSVGLTDNHPFNGPLMLIPGSHRTYVSCVGETPRDHYRQSLRKQEYGVPDPASLDRLAQAGGIAAPTGRPAGPSSSSATPCTDRTRTSRPFRARTSSSSTTASRTSWRNRTVDTRPAPSTSRPDRMSSRYDQRRCQAGRRRSLRRRLGMAKRQ